MPFDEPQSRNEAILQNMLGADNELGEPESRIESLLMQLLDMLQNQTGSGITYANLTYDGSTWELDKTYTEIKNAIENNKLVCVKYDTPNATVGSSVQNVFYYVGKKRGTDASLVFDTNDIGYGDVYRVEIDKDDDVTVRTLD